jgi:hypothetical protein
MGMFDDVYCEADLPPGHSESERSFQTNSLGNCLDTEFHGDIELVARVGDRLVEYIASFTHGTLERIQPLSELSEIQKRLLMH